MAAKKNDGNVTKRGLVEDESIQVRRFLHWLRPSSACYTASTACG